MKLTLPMMAEFGNCDEPDAAGVRGKERRFPDECNPMFQIPSRSKMCHLPVHGNRSDRPEFRVRVFAVLLFACFLSGCADFHVNEGSANPPQPPPTSPPPGGGQNGEVSISPEYAAVSPGQTLRFTATSASGGAIVWSVSGGGTIDQSGIYTAPASITLSENVEIKAALASAPDKNNATAVVAIISPGKIDCPQFTGNPQVAMYSVYLPAPGRVWVGFGRDNPQELRTWKVTAPSPYGGQARLWVAGMLGNTKYRLQGHIELDNGATFDDAETTCTTGAAPITSKVQVTQSGSAPPQSGIEMWNTVLPQNDTQLFATDLQGHVVWTYSYKHPVEDFIQGVQLLPNGHLLMPISFLSSLNYKSAATLINEIREIDLAGNTIRSFNIDDLNSKMAASSFRDGQGAVYVFKSFHHHVVALPNGHWVVLASYTKTYDNLTGIRGATVVLGDALIDVDESGNPDWVWSAFDHLDVNRHPMNFPDWTHSNAVLYSTDDHNLLISLRHQNWILKIEFLDGRGSGKIIWKLGKGGDFDLLGGADPADWFYAQHGMSYASSNTTGHFRLVLMDNGNDRYLQSGQVNCNPTNSPNPAECYSTMPVLEIDENKMTATFVHHYVPSPRVFSYFGGNAELLPNRNYEVTFAAASGGAIVHELDSTAANIVWQAITPGAAQYSVSRWPSLYPGVQW